MNKNGREDNRLLSTKYTILFLAYLIIFASLIMGVTKTENQNLLIATSSAILILVLLNLSQIIKNKRKINSIKMYSKLVTETDIHPLELYAINCVWYHRKNKFNKQQIYAAVLYEIEKGNLELTDKGVKISSSINLDELSLYSLKAMEMSLLEQIDCRKIRRLKMSKLKKLQAENVSIVMEDFNSNIAINCTDTDNFYEIMNDVKEKYFEEIESSVTAPLTLVSWICVLFSIILVLAFYNKATVLNFYLPVGLVVLLVATTTSKYRERVVIKSGKKEFINDSLNYINYLKNSDENKINKIYAYCLEKTNDISIIKIFN